MPAESVIDSVVNIADLRNVVHQAICDTRSTQPTTSGTAGGKSRKKKVEVTEDQTMC